MKHGLVGKVMIGIIFVGMGKQFVSFKLRIKLGYSGNTIAKEDRIHLRFQTAMDSPSMPLLFGGNPTARRPSMVKLDWNQIRT